MRKNIVIAVAAIIVAGSIAAYFYWQHAQQKAEPVHVQASPPAPLPPAPKPVVQQQVIEAAPAQPPLPELAGSDKLMLDTLAGLLGNRTLMKLFHAERIIHNIVATIDSLPRRRVPLSVMPVEPAHEVFIAEDTMGGKIIGQKNAARYAVYVSLAEAIDAQKLVEAYVRLYPLFQQAYEELGYPKKYFNDCLLVAIDNLLAAPDPKKPVMLVQPNAAYIFYSFADPDLEARSAGQKILMRMGSRNEARIKARLRGIKQQLKLHMHDKKVESAE